jgi:glycosyltransferase involved in cell wall biosynthesis
LAAIGVPLGPYLLMVGTIEPRKNHVGALRAFAELRRRGLPHRLVIAGGRGWLDGPIFGEYERLRLGDSVLFPSYFPDRLLPALYACADLLLQPSYYEGFGIPVLEAMGAGTPAIISDRPSLPEIAGGAARIVQIEDPQTLAEAIWSLLQDPAERMRMRERGLERVRDFAPGTVARTVLERYRAIE